MISLPKFLFSVFLIASATFIYLEAAAENTALPHESFAESLDGSCNAGISPGAVPICENGPMCLFDLLEGSPTPDGFWTGPAGWTSTDCGTFDPSADPPGDYTYTVLGLNDESCTANITMIYNDLGTLSYYTWCDPNTHNLFSEVNNPNGLPIDGDWYYPGTYPDITGIVVNGIVDPNTDNSGLYEYAFYDEGNCLTTASANILFSTSGAAGIETWVSITPETEIFCPFDWLQGNPAPGGNWLHYDATGTNFIAYYTDYDHCVEISTIENDALFKYVLGAPPCAPALTNLHLNILPGNSLAPDTSHSICYSAGEISLNDLIDPNIETGGIWTNPEGENISTLIDTETALNGIYTYTISEGLNPGFALLHLEIILETNAGPDVLATFCGDGSVLNLFTILDPSVDFGGVFTPTHLVQLVPGNAGTYTYTTSGECPSDNASYYIQIIEQLVTDPPIASCEPNMAEYTVTFEVVNGIPPFTVEGNNGGTMTENTFTSNPISAGLPYEFQVSGNELCSDIVVSGLSPICICPASFSSISAENTELCPGQCTNLIFELEGTGPFNIVYSDGNGETEINDIFSNSYSTTICPFFSTTYTLISVENNTCIGAPVNETVSIEVEQFNQAGPDMTLTFCADSSIIFLADYLSPEALDNGIFNVPPLLAVEANSGVYTYSFDGDCSTDEAEYTVIFSSLPQTNNLSIDCHSEDPNLYYVSVDITGGLPPYTSSNGTFSDNLFTSDLFSVADQPNFTILIEDQNGCTTEVSGMIQDNNGNGICDAAECNPGISPGDISICGGPTCLFDLLEGMPDPNGTWIGPQGWTSNASSCGLFNPTTDPLGAYTYAIIGANDEICTATLNIIAIGTSIDLGVVDNIAWCNPGPLNLYNEVTIPEGLPEEGNWYYPGTYPATSGIIPEGMADPSTANPGLYEYAFSNGGNCPTTASANVLFSTGGMSGVETWVDICANSGLVCPFDLLEGNPAPGGQWLYYDSNGNFNDFYPVYNPCLNITDLESGGYFTYVLGAPPCSPAFTDVHINILEGILLANDTSLTLCSIMGNIVLNDLIDSNVQAGGIWNNPLGEIITNTIDTETALSGTYSYTLEDTGVEPCYAIANLTLDIEALPFAGPDSDLAFCPDGTEIFLSNYLAFGADANGEFENPSFLAMEANAGVYTYQVSTETCGSDEAVYSVSFHTFPETSNLSIDCNIGSPTTYSVSVEATNGLPPYTSPSGTFNANYFSSELFSVANQPTFNIIIEDQNGCATEISGVIDDTDGDGVCDDGEIVGCQDPTAPNYNPFATDPGLCEAGGYDIAPDELTEDEPGTWGGWGIAGESGNVEYKWDFSVFPNPWQSETKLRIALKGMDAEEAFIIELYDLTGRLVWKQSMTVQNGFEIYPLSLPTELDAGTYLFSVVAESGERKSKILVIAL